MAKATISALAHSENTHTTYWMIKDTNKFQQTWKFRYKLQHPIAVAVTHCANRYLRQTFAARFKICPQMNKYIDLPCRVKVGFATHFSIWFQQYIDLLQLYCTSAAQYVDGSFFKNCFHLSNTFSSTVIPEKWRKMMT